MTIPCTRGLFIGVSKYGTRAELPDLASTHISVLELYNHFRNVYEAGEWSILTDSHDRFLERADLLEALTEWLPRIRDDTAGLLYFAGHGLCCEDGTVLSARDFRPSIPADSGISIGHIDRLFRKLSKPNAYLLLLVDVCRHGDGPPDEISDRVCVVYASGSGRPARESDAKSVFVDLLLETLANSPRFSFEIFQGIDVLSLGKNLKRAATVRPSNGQEPEIVGNSLGTIVIPVNISSVPNAPMKSKNPPRSVLISRAMDRSALVTHLHTINSYIETWFGLYGSSGEVTTIVDQDMGSEIRIDLPGGTYGRWPHEFLSFLLTYCGAVFYRIEMEWVSEVVFDSIAMLERENDNFSYQKTDGVTAGLYWSVRNSKGQAQLHDFKTDGATVVISCCSRENVPLPLENLLPELNDLYDTFYSLTS